MGDDVTIERRLSLAGHIHKMIPEFLSTNKARCYQFAKKYIARFLSENGTLVLHMKPVIHTYC